MFCIYIYTYTHSYSFWLYRRIDHLETTLAAEREAPATLPVTNGSHTSSQDSLNEIPTHDNHPASATLTPHTQVLSDEEVRKANVGFSDIVHGKMKHSFCL